MKSKICAVLLVVTIVALCAQGQRRKVIIDQDARGPATTDQQSMLMLLQSPDVEPLGITVVSGDQWRDEEVAHTLRMLELTGHTNIKVYPGAVFPLINSKEEIKRWQTLYGVVEYRARGMNISLQLAPGHRRRAPGDPSVITHRLKCRIRFPKGIPRSNRRGKTRLIS